MSGSEEPHAGSLERGASCVRAHRQWSPLGQALLATGDQWTLLIVVALASGPCRLARLQEGLPGISTGVLDRHLRQMASFGLLSRERFREAPPRVELTLTDAGRELLPIASALASWGMRHNWVAPSADEQVDVDALLELLPALLDRSGLPDATVEAILTQARGRSPHAFTIERGQIHAVDPSRGVETICIEGDRAAWIAAIGPSHDFTSLRLAGSEDLARRILDALPRPASAKT
jgi:DNA-binding HxlR family transcriptional regulator